jgi:hypothetical protein
MSELLEFDWSYYCGLRLGVGNSFEEFHLYVVIDLL